MLDREGDHLVGGGLGLVEDAGGVGVVAEQPGDDLGGRGPGRDAVAGGGELLPEPVALGVGALLQAAEVDRHRLSGRQDPLQRAAAEGGVGVAVLGGCLQMRDEALVGVEGGSDGLAVPVPVEVGDQAAGRTEQGLGDRGRDPVERGDRLVDRVGPGGEVAAAGLGALLGGGVVAVVAGQVQLADVPQGATAVQLQLAELQPHGLLDGPDPRLVVRVRTGRGAAAEAGDAGADPVGRQVRHDAVVVVVEADVFPGGGDVEVADGLEARVHCAGG